MDRVLTFAGTSLALLGAAAATVTACAGKALDVGNDSGGAALMLGGSSALGGTGNAMGGTGAGPSPAPPLTPEDLATMQYPPEDEVCEPAPSSPLVGQWSGRWPTIDGSSKEAVLTISGLTPDGVPCGTFRVGEGEPLPPPADADALYPETYPSDYAVGMGGRGSMGFVGLPFPDPWPGFEYRLLQVESSGSRLSFKVTFNEIVRPWCQLQPAYADSYSCLPEYTMATMDGDSCAISGPNLPLTPVSCWRMQYCSSMTCFCYDGRCDVGLQMVPFELHWDGPALEGTVFYDGKLIFLDPVP